MATKIFLSALEASPEFAYIDERIPHYLFNLMSFYYIKDEIFTKIKNKSELVLVDSGAFSFQQGRKVDWIDYTKKYSEFIEKYNDDKKVLGFFEMDIDPLTSDYALTLSLRNILTTVSNKIIPVWHKNRGIEDFKNMCKNPIHKDRIIAITGQNGESPDLRVSDYSSFVAYAHYCGCKVHCLGMTTKKNIKNSPVRLCRQQ